MAQRSTHHDTADGIHIRRRTLLGVALAAGLLGPAVFTGTARADTGTEDPPGGDEYELPDGIGSAPWW